MKKTVNLLEGSVLRQLLTLTWPSIGGFLGIILFNLTDTFFVSRLGTDALAAMGFTFPVVMLIGSASLGISLGAGSVLSRAMGEGDRYHMKRTATDGILLSMIFVALVSIAGVLTLDPFFRMLGAEGKSLVLVKEYMLIWFLGSMTVMMPPVSDSCLRATGDMVRPFIVMMVCAVGNVILDPILIFGLFGLPAMGIRGAALATVISRFAGMVVTLSFLHFHAGLLDLSKPRFKEIRESWGRILHVGLPAAFTQLLPHLSRAVLTRMAAAVGGASAVAALAAGTRIEGFMLLFMLAYALAIVPMVGQNWGAGKRDRVRQVRRVSLKIALISGGLFFVVLLPLAPFIAGIFSSDPEVVGPTAFYLRMAAFGLAALSYITWINQSLNAAGKPLASARLNIITYILLIIPLAFLGARLAGFRGIVLALISGQYLGALWAHREGTKTFPAPPPEA